MKKSNHIANRDIRSIYLLLGECCALGRFPQAWVRRLHEGLGSLLGVQVSVWIEGHWDTVAGKRGPKNDDHILTIGIQNPQVVRLQKEFLDNDTVRDDPTAPAWQQIPGRFIARTRQQLADDHAWYNSRVYNEYYRLGGADQMAMARCPVSPGQHLLHQVWRNVGDRPFTPRDLALLQLVQIEVHRLRQQGKLAPLHTPCPEDLTPRLQQVLDLLAQGRSEKETAAALGLSVHTVHDHVKRLYLKFGVGSRSELLATLYHWASPDVTNRRPRHNQEPR